MLEAFLSGGYWPEERCYEAQLIDPPACKRCGHQKDDAFHVLWGCSKNSEINDLHVACTQGMVVRWRQGLLIPPVSG